LKQSESEPLANIDHSVVRGNYDRLSRWYDLLEGNWEREPREAALAGLEICPGGSVLEIGCGTGNSLEVLPEITAGSGKVFFVDLSMGMLRQAQKRVQPGEIADQLVLAQADAVRLPFRDEFFDIVFLSFTLEVFSQPEIPVVLADCYRVLKPGACLGAVAVSTSGGWGWMVWLYERIHKAFPQVVDCAPIDLGNYLEEAGFCLVSRRTFSLFGIGVEAVTARK
jgi:ubiquinone/menaquinone biosynthesis C-methylase UbiE